MVLDSRPADRVATGWMSYLHSEPPTGVTGNLLVET